MSNLRLGFSGLVFRDLYHPVGLKKIFNLFCKELSEGDPILATEYQDYLSGKELSVVDESNFLIKLSPYVSGFVAKLFGIEAEVEKLVDEERALTPIFAFKKEFVLRRALKKFTGAEAHHFNAKVLEGVVGTLIVDPEFSHLPEEATARFVVPLLALEKSLENGGALASEMMERLTILKKRLQAKPVEGVSLPSDESVSENLRFLKELLAPIEKWIAALSHQELGRSWASLHLPKKLEFENLVELERPDAGLAEKITGLTKNFRHRDGFDLTDKRMSLKKAIGEVDYCIYCHDRDKDSCSKGLRDNRTKAVLKNPLGITLNGCPLDEKISEAHVLRKNGDFLGALAMVIVDNPMCPGTGHRICNDCMKACIFQKQDPVNIPEIETNILSRALALPFGFEIFSFLTRWNPLNRKRPYALPYNGKNVLVVGMGPAGYTLSHYLLNEGFGVVGVDGLKIEPLPKNLSGPDFQPIAEIGDLYENLNNRVLTGFGGVAEYGITVRWDKNFLKVIYATLARREKFCVYGGVRFGGTVTIEDAWRLGFDHIAMATGAGKPTVIKMKNNLIRGVRKASDFLMALQLTGAFKKSTMANLQIQLPAMVVGGGLTAIDTATEIMAYYPGQVEKFLDRFEILSSEFGEKKVLEFATDEDKEILKTFLKHGHAVRDERKRATVQGRSPNFIDMIRSWGGVSIAYRKRLIDSPAYRLNHEEVSKALEEGIFFIENMNPVEALRDKYGALGALKFKRQLLGGDGKWSESSDIVTLPAKSLCVAAGTSPNIIYEKERPGTFKLDEWGKFFEKFYDDGGELKSAQDRPDAFLTSYAKSDRRISFYGDNHPEFAGNVVKAMASAKNGYPHVVALFQNDLAKIEPTKLEVREKAFEDFSKNLDSHLKATVENVVRLTPTIIEVIVKAPLAAKNFEPGQFYRLQNYESFAPKIDGTSLTMEGIALTGAWTDKDKGLLSMIVLEMGTSSRLCAALKKGEPVVVMGPTGAPTEIPTDETILLAGGGLGNAVLFSIGQALKKNGNRVVYFAGYKNSADIFKRDEIEKGTDLVVWSNDVGDLIKPRRVQDRSFFGNIVQSIVAYGDGKLGAQPIQLSEVDRIIAIGSDRMMNAVRESRHGILAPYLKKGHVAIGSINSSMQCMMKEVCAQCLQKHVDPVTGKETLPVFSCFNQDQKLDEVDFQNLNERLKINHLQELVSNLWLDHLLKIQDVPRI